MDSFGESARANKLGNPSVRAGPHAGQKRSPLHPSLVELPHVENQGLGRLFPDAFHELPRRVDAMLIHDLVQNRKNDYGVEGRRFAQKLRGHLRIDKAGPFVFVEKVDLLGDG